MASIDDNVPFLQPLCLAFHWSIITPWIHVQRKRANISIAPVKQASAVDSKGSNTLNHNSDSTRAMIRAKIDVPGWNRMAALLLRVIDILDGVLDQRQQEGMMH